MLKQFFDISTGFGFSKLQWGSVPSIPVAVLDLAHTWNNTLTLLPTTIYPIMAPLC